METKLIRAIIIFLIPSLWGCSGRYTADIESPDGNIRMLITTKKEGDNRSIFRFSVTAWGRQVLEPSPVMINSLTVDLTGEFKIVKSESESVRNTWINNFGERREVPDNYNMSKLYLQSGDSRINVICRAYNEGAAFAWEIPGQQEPESVVINDENISFRFPADYMAWSAPRAQAQYSHVPLRNIPKGCERPLVIEYDTNLVMALAEAKLVDFARMKFEPDTAGSIAVRTRLDSDVQKTLPFQSPWRVIMVGKNPMPQL